jgi:hydrogenase nickel incorporation protein HypA/HybF
MHEASIANELANLASQQARLHSPDGTPGRIVAVGVRLGALSSVVAEALEFAWPAASAGTLAAGARLVIEQLPAQAICPSHGPVLLDLRRGLRCPICDRPTPEIIQGEELELDTLELE